MTRRLRPLSVAEVRKLDVQAAVDLALPTSILMENAGRGAAGRLAELVGAASASARERTTLLRAATSETFREGEPPGEPSADARSDGASHSQRGRRGSRRVEYSVATSTLAGEAPDDPLLPKILILCGPGNNGGDGGVVARHLDGWGFPVRVIWFARRDQLRGDAALQWTILDKSGVDQSAWFDTAPRGSDFDLTGLAAILNDADWLVDGLMGTGLSRPVEEPLFTLIDAMNRSGKPILALDLPSGLDADTGSPLGIAVRATHTATFVAAKVGFTAPGASEYTGAVTILDIGLPRCLLSPFITH